MVCGHRKDAVHIHVQTTDILTGNGLLQGQYAQVNFPMTHLFNGCVTAGKEAAAVILAEVREVAAGHGAVEVEPEDLVNSHFQR